ncbi:MAG: hypothetical protein P8J79_13115 [Halioglobus sp.]|nr:hypothetical protein [Halioglobus sp.]
MNTGGKTHQLAAHLQLRDFTVLRAQTNRTATSIAVTVFETVTSSEPVSVETP